MEKVREDDKWELGGEDLLKKKIKKSKPKI